MTDSAQQQQLCPHLHTEMVRNVQPSGSWWFEERCAVCHETRDRFMTQRAVVERVLRDVPWVQAYRPDPDLAEICAEPDCDQPGTVAHHPVSGSNWTLWICAYHHQRAHGGGGHRGVM